MSKGIRPSAVQSYAVRFALDNIGMEPTDANLLDALKGGARPLPFKLLEPVRRAVIAYRASSDYAAAVARAQGASAEAPADAAAPGA